MSAWSASRMLLMQATPTCHQQSRIFQIIPSQLGFFYTLSPASLILRMCTWRHGVCAMQTLPHVHRTCCFSSLELDISFWLKVFLTPLVSVHFFWNHMFPVGAESWSSLCSHVQNQQNLPPNMESFRQTVKPFTERFIKTAGVYTTIIGIFTYHVLLDKDMPCTCREQTRDCMLYLFLPGFIITVLMLWLDKTCLLAIRYMCREFDDSPCCFFVCRLVKGLLVGLLWVVSVFLDGDWYVCCLNDGSKKQSMLACKDKANITSEDRRLIAELKNKSRVSFSFSLLTTSWFSLLLQERS